MKFVAEENGRNPEKTLPRKTHGVTDTRTRDSSAAVGRERITACAFIIFFLLLCCFCYFFVDFVAIFCFCCLFVVFAMFVIFFLLYFGFSFSWRSQFLFFFFISSSIILPSATLSSATAFFILSVHFTRSISTSQMLPVVFAHSVVVPKSLHHTTLHSTQSTSLASTAVLFPRVRRKYFSSC